MSTNGIYDVLIIGASLDGIKAYNKLKKHNITSLAVVSTSFNNCTRYDTIKLSDRIVGTVNAILYKRGIVSVSIDDKQNLYCRQLIIATGSISQPLNLKAPNVYYNIAKLKAFSKLKPIFIIGPAALVVPAAKKLAAKYNYIYVGLFEQNVPEVAKSLLAIKNIVVLPNCTVTGYNKTKLNELASLKTTCGEFHCAAVLVCTARYPDTAQFKKLLSVDDTGAIIVNESFETATIPCIYAIGDCATINKQVNTSFIKALKIKLRGESDVIN